VGRSASGEQHPKLRELVRAELFDYADAAPQLAGYDACLFCLGVSSAGMSEADYTRVTYDLTLAAAKALLAQNPGMTFCFISGASTDATEQGSSMWARVKGKTENALQQLGFKAAYMFRPGVIQPVKGVTSRTRAYRIFYAIFWPLMPVLKALFPRHILTTESLGKAMIRVARDGWPKPVLEAPDIHAAASDPRG
jgi:uncharacterized protein YbjT (DUF2867 family)